MARMFEVGNTVEFTYNAKVRTVKIEKVVREGGLVVAGEFVEATKTITGFSYSEEGYRSFSVVKIIGEVKVTEWAK